MNLADAQPTVAALLGRHPALHDVPIVLDDGLGEANKDRVAALKTGGLCLLVWRVESGAIVSVSKTGALLQRLLLFVFVEESVPVCRGAGGLKISAETAAQQVMEALSGARVGAERLTLDDPPFDNLGRVNGVNRILVSALGEFTLVPLSP